MYQMNANKCYGGSCVYFFISNAHPYFNNPFFERGEIILENINDLWSAALEKIEEQISKPSFDTQLKNTEAKSLEGNKLTVSAPNEFARDWLEEQYTELIGDVLTELTGAELITRFVIPESVKEDKDIKPAPKTMKNITGNQVPLKTMLCFFEFIEVFRYIFNTNPRFTFVFTGH